MHVDERNEQPKKEHSENKPIIHNHFYPFCLKLLKIAKNKLKNHIYML